MRGAEVFDSRASQPALFQGETVTSTLQAKLDGKLIFASVRRNLQWGCRQEKPASRPCRELRRRNQPL